MARLVLIPAKERADSSRAGPDLFSVGELSRRIVAGDDEAFAEFYQLYSRRMYAFLFVLTRGNESLSQELQQAVFIRAARKFRHFESEPELWGWLCAVARNSFLDHLRREERRDRREAVAVGSVEDNVAAEQQLENALQSALAFLTPEERVLVDEFYFESRPQHSLAENHGISVKAVQSRLARIRQKLRALISRSIQEDL